MSQNLNERPVLPNEEQLQAIHKEIAMLNQQRQGSLETLKKRVTSLMENDKVNVGHMSPASVEAHRDSIFALNAGLQMLEAHNRLIDLMTHDLSVMVESVGQAAAYIQTLLFVLKDKGVLADGEMQAKWDSLMGALKSESGEEKTPGVINLE